MANAIKFFMAETYSENGTPAIVVFNKQQADAAGFAGFDLFVCVDLPHAQLCTSVAAAYLFFDHATKG